LGIILSRPLGLARLPNPPQAFHTRIRATQEAFPPADWKTLGGAVEDYRLGGEFSIRFIRRFHS
jgi:hypothetical protein